MRPIPTAVIVTTPAMGLSPSSAEHLLQDQVAPTRDEWIRRGWHMHLGGRRISVRRRGVRQILDMNGLDVNQSVVTGTDDHQLVFSLLHDHLLPLWKLCVACSLDAGHQPVRRSRPTLT
jgi:hypothetical protein